MMIGDNEQEYSIDVWIQSLQQRNLVYNHDFRYFSNQTTESSVIFYSHPDGWVYADPGPGGQIGLEAPNCRIVTSRDDTSKMTFSQALHEFPRWESALLGKTVSAKVCLSISSGSRFTVSLTDGNTTVSQTISSEGETVVELHLDVSVSAQKLCIEIASVSNAAVVTIGSICANVGCITIENLPCMVCGVIGETRQYIATHNPPAEELSLCRAPVELGPNETRLSSVINGRFGTGPAKRSLLPDVRGLFIRAWNNNANVDPDAATRTMLGDPNKKGDFVGTSETDIFAAHVHELKYAPQPITMNTGSAATGLNTTTTSSTESTGGAETRPKNVAELMTIKWA